MNGLTDKVAVVTGAGRGIGKAIALLLARSGCRLVLTARSDDQLREVQQEILSSRGQAVCVTADLTRDEDLYRLGRECVRPWGRVDILINNAGWGKRASVADAALEDWDQTLRLNLRAPMILSKAFVPAMIERSEGAVINIGSVSGKAGEANGSAYSASKFGLIGFTQSLYEEVRELGIKVAVILPGFVDTPLIPPNRRLDRSKMIRSDDVADAVLYVLSSRPTCCPVEIALRPQQSPYR